MGWRWRHRELAPAPTPGVCICDDPDPVPIRIFGGHVLIDGYDCSRCRRPIIEARAS